MSWEDLLRRQCGVVELDQAVAHGVSARTVQRRAAEGRWRRLHPRVYLAGGHRLTPEARIRAAVLWAGPEAVLTGPAAAYWHGLLTRAPEAIELTVPARVKPRAQPGVVLRRRLLDRVDVEIADGVRVAAAPFAALETACVLADGSTFLDRTLQTRVRFPALHRCYTRNLGRPGWARAATLMVAAADRADSAAERLLVHLLRRAGIAGWALDVPFGPFRIDLAFPQARVAVEVDGWAWHVDAERFQADRRKGNALSRAGWVLLRFTWHDLDRRPAAVLAEIREVLGTP